MTADIRITPLGAGQEVGRSCILVSIGDFTVMCDCGFHQGYRDHRAFPDFTFILPPELEPGSAECRAELTRRVDAVLISHFHLDHVGALPFFTETVGYDGPVYMTQPTRAISPLLLEDMRRISERRGDEAKWTQDDLRRCFNKVQHIGLRESVEVCSGLRVTAYYAGHVLGACMFLIEAGPLSVLYTGDYNMQADRHLTGAKVPPGIRPTCLITETTYGSTVRDSKRQRERDFLKLVHDTVAAGGKVLIPVFALGRAQELLILLETYWARMGLTVPIYFSPGMVRRANEYYRLFVAWTNEAVQGEAQRNVFDFPHVRADFEERMLHDDGPMVLFSTPGMLHGGLSLRAFRAWCGDARSTVIIPGFCTEGTLGHEVITTKDSTVTIDNEKVTFRCTCKWMSLSAHADARGILRLIQTACPEHVVLVHGDRRIMEFFKGKVADETKVPCSMPGNGSTCRITAPMRMPVAVSEQLVRNAAPRGAAAAVQALCNFASSLAAEPLPKRPRQSDLLPPPPTTVAPQWWSEWGVRCAEPDAAPPTGPCDMDCGCDFCQDAWQDAVRAEISAGRPEVDGEPSKYAVLPDGPLDNWGSVCPVDAVATLGDAQQGYSVVIESNGTGSAEAPCPSLLAKCRFTARLSDDTTAEAAAANREEARGDAMLLALQSAIPTAPFAAAGNWGSDWVAESRTVRLTVNNTGVELLWCREDAALARRVGEVACDTFPTFLPP
eukprot:TRINITY_DN56350_c0_g1_i1.p1 TRINITY_DN56350_c0_g1~~TRINITY_DN56350_c0_g1_i1.p1  ORF type:complete len:746 (+),score=229.55 TRINITY_DN56350_c0_g1_i1:67-2238(+)